MQASHLSPPWNGSWTWMALLGILALFGLAWVAPPALAQVPNPLPSGTVAEPLEKGADTYRRLPVCPDSPTGGYEAGTPASGCPMWSRDVPGDAVTSIPDDGEVLAAGFDGDTLEVRRLDPARGQVNWTQRIPLDQVYEDVALKVDAEHESLYIGWETFRWQERHKYSRFEEGGVARLALATGDLVWTRDDGSTGLAVGPDGEHVYYGISEPGRKYRWSDWGSDYWSTEYQDASLHVHALHAANGTQAWTNSTSLWWDLHTADERDRYLDMRCNSGPGEVAVGADGTVLVANDPRCDAGGTLAAFRSTGELQYLKTFPDSLGSGERTACSQGCPGFRDAELAVHPAGHTVVVAWSDYLAAYDVLSGDKRWDTHDNDLLEPCPLASGYCYDKLAHGPDDLEGESWTTGMGKALDVTPAGEIVLTGFSREPSDENRVKPWVTIFEAETGYWVAGTQQTQPGANWLKASESPQLQSDIEVGPAGATIYAAFETGEEARAFGYLFTGDSLWGYQNPHWEAREHSGEPARWAANIAPGENGIVVGDHNLTGHVPDSSLAQVRQAGMILNQRLPEEATDAVHEAQRTVTRALQGDRVREGVPTVLVEASDGFHAEANISEPGVYYLLVENVTSGGTYAFMDATGLSGDGAPGPTECEGASVFAGVSDELCDVPNPAGWEEACTPTGSWRIGTRSTTGNCYGRSREDPVTVTRANYADGREVGNGSALFGPVVLTEGRYAILEHEEGNGPIDSVALTALEAAAQCTSGTFSPAKMELVECLEIHVRFDEADLGMAPPSDPFRSTTHWEGDGCRADTSGTFRPWRSKTEPNRTSSKESRILGSSIGVFGIAFEQYPFQDRCVVNIGTALGQASFLLFGKTDFFWEAEWAVVFSVSGDCTRDGEPVSCSTGDWDTRLAHRTPSSCLPDQNELYVGELLEEPGTTAAEQRRSEASGGFLESLWDNTILKKIYRATQHTVDWLGFKEDDFVPKQCEMEAMDECGAGCQEWAWTVAGEEEFLHRYEMHVGECGEVEYPVSWGIEASTMLFEAEYHPTQAWSTEPATIDQNATVDLHRWDCDA